ncbi:hypothetical protein EV182_000658 [Spiromyces aspiralis]|uniref:Uncharacterized protein n=1 Tax=Spiromyces aspiralis TaxID=68401 RepID=A0ACC1HI85_9FUNG|nr:hypothetical protein EV182_000658 [Spiromyces aspiralis]
MSKFHELTADQKQLVQVLGSKRLTYEAFEGIKLLIIDSLSEMGCLTYLQEVLFMEEGTFDRLSVIKILSKAWPGMDASAKEEVFNAVCGPTQEGATPEEGAPGPAGVREVTEAMGDIAIDTPRKSTVATSKGTKSFPAGQCTLATGLNHTLKLNEDEKARLAADIHARMESMALAGILDRIGCSGEYRGFVGEHEADVAELVKSLPKTPGPKEDDQQASLMPFLQNVVDKANEIWRQKDPTSRSPRKYYVYDTHLNAPRDTDMKPDALVSTDKLAKLGTAELVVEFKKDEDRGARVPRQNTLEYYAQLGKYACHAWAGQPTRRFVPIFLVHRLQVDLFVFARHTVYRASIGSALADNPSNKAIASLLLFLLSGEKSNLGVALPPMPDSGWAVLFSSPCQRLFCQRLGVRVDKKAIIQQQQQQPTSPRPDNHPTASHFEIDEVVRLSQPDLFGRIAFLARGTFVDSGGKRTKAVLKFVRREAIRQAEGEAYGVLRWKEVPHVPELLLSGYADEWGSGVLECLVVADAGRSLRDYPINDVNARRDPELLWQIATVVTQCLVAASQAGVHHRDISIGNICVDAGSTVRVIDWGCTRVEPETLQAYRKKLMVDFPGDPSLSSLPDADRVANEEKRHDPFTGTRHFLSVRVLLRHTLRSVIDDIESLLYVLVYFIAKDRDVFKNAPLCRKGLTEEELALKKTSAFTCLNHFHWWAGLNDLDLKLSQRDQECFEILKTFIERLFFDKESATSLSSSLLIDKRDPRMSYDSAYWLISRPQKATSPDSGVALADH